MKPRTRLSMKMLWRLMSEFEIVRGGDKGGMVWEFLDFVERKTRYTASTPNKKGDMKSAHK